MKTRIVHTKVWRDSWFKGLTSGQRLLWLYLITNPDVNIINCYEIDIGQICFDTGLTSEQIKSGIERFSDDKKIFYFKNYIYLANGDRYQKFVGEKNDEGKRRLISEMSKEVQDWFLDTPIDTPIKGVYIPTSNKKSVISNKKSEQGGVGGKPNLTPDDLKEIAGKMSVLEIDATETYEALCDWCTSKSKTYTDYKAALRNWIRKRLTEGEIERQYTSN